MQEVPRADESAVTSRPTPRYLAMLEEERSAWWQSKNWDKWATHYVSEYPRGKFVLDTLERYVPSFRPDGARVLDVGCGDAGVLIAFAERGAEATGIEPNASSLERGTVRAEEHGVRLDLRIGNAESLPFADSSFDLVVLDNVLEHVADRDRTLAEIQRVLKPAGLLYLVTPKPYSLHSLWSDPHYSMAGLVLLPRKLQIFYFERIRRGGAGNYGVGWIPTRKSAARMLASHGFASLVSPRELWINYLRAKITDPKNISPGLKRRIGAWVANHRTLTEHPIARWLWDVATGANIFIARRL